ncbi:MAG: glycine zipper 2TM domain-containing protein [Erythrobacter sp.]|nr:glycine zipper 2TM domain-containing protein [Erythrobacter sp.]MDZ4273701.1 glycine zipper 2TM domain-containing protein [Erythrobacter sp.]MDZ4276700.1 glycine zipper 2TM domain-containing protein [Erythrobacter sp.]
MRLPLRNLTSLGVILPALALPAMAGAQDYSDLPPLTPVDEAAVRSLPPEYRTAPVMNRTAETVTAKDGVETITRTRWIEAPRRQHVSSVAPHAYPNHSHAPAAYTPAPVVFEREQWLDECRRRTAGRDNDETGLIIGGLLGAIAGGVVGHEIAKVGDRTLGAVVGAGGGGLIGGLLGSLIGGGKKKDRYDCEAALDGYLSQYGAPGARVAAREIAYAPYPAAPAYGYGYPANYGYTYAPPPQMVMVPVRSEVQQQVVVRETVREETYTVPSAARVIPAPAPSPKMIKGGR